MLYSAQQSRHRTARDEIDPDGNTPRPIRTDPGIVLPVTHEENEVFYCDFKRSYFILSGVNEGERT